MGLIADTVWELPRSMRGVTESRFYLSASAFDATSPWTNERTPYGPFVQVWLAELTFPPAPSVEVTRSDGRVLATWREFQGFVTRLRGTAGKLRLPDSFRIRPYYDIKTPAGSSRWSNDTLWSDGSTWSQGALPPFVTMDEAADAEADSIVVRGLPPNLDGLLNPADLMEGRPNGVATTFSNLYEIVHVARSNSDGKARVYFQPGLRQGFAAGDTFILREPMGVFRLADKNQGIVTRSVDGFGRLGLSLIEQMPDV